MTIFLKLIWMRFYSNADVLIYPSYYEELGYVTLEAMASGLAIITSDIPSFRDTVLDGTNGFLIEPNDEKQLANYLRLFIGDERPIRRMG